MEQILKRMSATTSAAADDRVECGCAEGKMCPVKANIDSMFKQCYREQMIDLMRKIIDDASDPNLDCTTDSKRVTNLKKEMDVVRRLKNNPWPDLTSLYTTSKAPICVTTRKILYVTAECSGEMYINETLCLCTCITDLCVMLVAKHYGFAIHEIIETVVNFIVEQNLRACRDFLFWLDNL